MRSRRSAASRRHHPRVVGVPRPRVTAAANSRCGALGRALARSPTRRIVMDTKLGLIVVCAAAACTRTDVPGADEPEGVILAQSQLAGEIAQALCDHKAHCGEIGPDREYVTLGRCVSASGDDAADDADLN